MLCLLFIGAGSAWGAVTPLNLPKTWADSDGKSAYTEALGCTLNGLGTDYSAAPKLKFDTQGDYMIIQLADAPAAISFNIKGNNVSGTYSFKVQESSDGTSYTDALNITSVGSSASQKSADLKSSTRYVKLIYTTKASGNMGVGGISITKDTTTPSGPTAGTYTVSTNNSLYGISTGNNGVEQTATSKGITVISGCKSTATNKTYYDTNHIRYYGDSYMKLTAPDGFEITKVVFTSGGTWNSGPKVVVGTYTNTSKTWTGAASSIDFSFPDQNRVSSIAVTYAAVQKRTLAGISLSGDYTTDFWEGDAFDKTGLVVTANYEEDGVEPKIVTNDAVVTAPTPWGTLGEGQTVTVSYTEGSVTKTQTYQVNIKTIANTQETAYTVEEAIALIDAGKGLKTEVYVKGTVCDIISTSDPTDGSLDFWISSDGATNGQKFELYKNKKSDTEGWSSLDDINVGDDVVAYGKLTKYNSTYEFAAGNYLVYHNHIEIPSHTASFSVNGQVDAENEYEGKERTAITFPAVADQDGMTFIGWSLAKVSATAVEPTLVDTKTAVFGEEDVTFYAVFATKIEGKKTVTEDVLNRALTGVTGSTYSDWSGKTVTDGSGAVYAGNSAGGNSSIQLRSTNSNSGIITTTSGGIITKVKVSWNSNTDSGRTIDVYGKTSAYSSAANLYNAAADGTKIGSIKIGTSTELTIDLSEGYTYVGIRSYSGALYLDDITIEWTNAEPDTYCNYCTEYTTASLKAEANGCKYATFSCKDNVVIPAEDNNATFNVYAVGVDDDHIVLSDFVADFANADAAGNAIVPAGTGVMIKATPKEGKTVTSVACALTDEEGNGYDTSLNNLIACTTTGQLLTVADGNTYYKLAYGTSDAHNGELGFYWGAAEGAGTFNVKAGGAVLKIEGAAAVRGFSFDVIEDTEDGIFNVNENDNKEIYNLAGQRIQKLQKGINIVGGKKILK